MDKKNKLRLSLEANLRNAVKNEEFILHYQPKLDIQSGNVIGMEALVRWNRAKQGLVMPGEFIEIAEETGIINSIGEYVLKAACIQSKIWVDKNNKKLRTAVNISGTQFEQKEFVDTVKQHVKKIGLPAELLELEITESMIIKNIDNAINILKELQDEGIHISVDDFGTGYSSLGYLKKLPINTLKIDRAFVRDIEVDPDGKAIVLTILSMAKSLNLNVVAEGVETKEQLDFLKEHGCNEIQGYYFSRPLSANDFEQFLDNNANNFFKYSTEFVY